MRRTPARRRPRSVAEIVVLDYGGQYSQLIARRVRDCGVFSELLPHHVPLEEVAARKPRGIILSGGPGVGVRAGRAAAGSRPAGAGRAGDGHLLRDAAARAHAGRAGRAGGGGRVRPLRSARGGPGRAAEGHAARADVLDVPPRHRVRAAAGLPRAGVLERLAGGGGRRARARASTGSSFTPRSCTPPTARRS